MRSSSQVFVLTEGSSSSNKTFSCSRKPAEDGGEEEERADVIDPVTMMKHDQSPHSRFSSKLLYLYIVCVHCVGVIDFVAPLLLVQLNDNKALTD